MVRPSARVVVSWHSDIVRQKRALRLYRPFLARFLDRADWVVAATPNYVQSSPFLGSCRHKCTVIPYSVDANRFTLTPEVEARVGFVRDREQMPIVLFVGRLVYYKGVEYLIEAMKDIEGTLVIIGEGPLEPRLRALAKELGLAQRVKFLKPMAEEELVSYYHACDLFVLPSVERSEAFGIVQLEAMACGKPVVSTELGTGVSFVNQHTKTGLVVPPRDPADLAYAIQSILGNPAIQEEYGRFAKARVERDFGPERMVSRTASVYEALLARRRTPSDLEDIGCHAEGILD
jgi:glycosyltransferase involved in cell wall biosynthesis